MFKKQGSKQQHVFSIDGILPIAGYKNIPFTKLQPQASRSNAADACAESHNVSGNKLASNWNFIKHIYT